MPNTLFYGDNLQVLRDHIPDESVDLVYLDPPFNSNASYNVLFREKSGEESPAQIKAFTDTWEWTVETERTFEEDIILNPGTPPAVKEMITAFRDFIGRNAMMAYLVMMTPRLVELRRVLKPTGSLYLHCDPTASHYLKILLDAVFGKENFRNEITWRRTGTHNKVRRFAPIHDTVFFYSKTNEYQWNSIVKPYMNGHVEEYFVQEEEGWRTNYYGNVLTGSGTRNGQSGQPWMGFDPTSKGRHWAIPRRLLEEVGEDLSKLSQHQKLDRLYELGYIKIVDGQAWPIYEHYIRPTDGQPVPDIWTYQPYTQGTVYSTNLGIDEDVRWLSPTDQERLGYPTQKPLGLLERIIQASSNEGDVILDPFCGCGTAVAAAQKLNRQWLGIDITHLAVSLMKSRLKDMFNLDPGRDYEVVGEPRDVGGARALFEQDPFQFQFWAVSLLEAVPQDQQKRGADRGIDGLFYFIDGPRRTPQKVVVQVKGGGVQVRDVRDLKGVLEREKAALGLFISLQEPTRPMREEEASGGFYQSDVWQRAYPKIQIRTIEQLLAGQDFDLPPRQSAYQAAGRVRRPEGEQTTLEELAG